MNLLGTMVLTLSALVTVMDLPLISGFSVTATGEANGQAAAWCRAGEQASALDWDAIGVFSADWETPTTYVLKVVSASGDVEGNVLLSEALESCE